MTGTCRTAGSSSVAGSRYVPVLYVVAMAIAALPFVKGAVIGYCWATGITRHGASAAVPARFDVPDSNRGTVVLAMGVHFLHAFQVGIIHPVTLEKLSLEAPLAEDLAEFMGGLHDADKPCVHNENGRN